MGLVQVDTETVTSGVSAVTLTGINTDDVYQVVINNLEGDTDVEDVFLRFTVSGSADDSSNYDRASKELKADSSFVNVGGVDSSNIALGDVGTGTGEAFNAVLYLFNFSNASEYSFCTYETTYLTSTPNLRGRQGGGVLTETQATDGVHFYMSDGNIDSGTFTLYKVI